MVGQTTKQRNTTLKILNSRATLACPKKPAGPYWANTERLTLLQKVKRHRRSSLNDIGTAFLDRHYTKSHTIPAASPVSLSLPCNAGRDRKDRKDGQLVSIHQATGTLTKKTKLSQDRAQPFNGFYTRFPRGERRQPQETFSSGAEARSGDCHHL